jgi:mannose-6-phosphate isomerase-like protein (cupin superfamily)
MKRTLTLVGIATASAVTCAVVLAESQQGKAQGKAVTFAASSKASFKDAMPGVSTSLIWGDTVKGPFGSFTRFVPGFDAETHTHTADVLLVVLKGAYLYKDDAGDKRVGAGDFMRIPGGHKHWSGGDAKEGALFYQETFGKFDLVPAK